MRKQAGLAVGVRVIGFLCCGFLCMGISAAQTAPEPVPVPPPPMGWSSWNSFSNTVDAQVVMDQARAMISSGMRKAGYEYVNIDEGWWVGTRDMNGNIVVDPKAWPALSAGDRPGDMSNIVRFIHRLGLKAGIYTDAGKDGCSMFPDLGPKYFNTGSEGHYQQDFLQFARWGFDYVKVDWCGGYKENLDPAVQYAEIAQAIAKAEKITGRRLYFSICNWGKNSPWTWAPNVGGSPADIWRTSGDIVAPIVAGHEHADRRASFEKMLSNFDQGIHPEAEHSGFYNDPDMMVLGMPGLTDEQNRLHMALWAISGAPLIVGADLTKLSPTTLSTLTNPAVLAIDQDAAGLQAIKVSEPEPGLQVWSKALIKQGERAVLLLNRTTSEHPIAVKWTDLGLSDAAPHITNLWTGEDLKAGEESYTVTVPAGDGVFLLVSGSESPATRYEPIATAGAAIQRGAMRQRAVRFANVKAHAPISRIQIVYSNPDPTPRYAQLQVNGERTTGIAFPPTRNEKQGFLWIELALDNSIVGNELTFTASGGPGPLIQSISVR